MKEYIVEKKQTSGGWTWAEPKGELIRCKDCKHGEDDDGEILCTFWDFCDCNHHVLKNGFCDRAEGKEE